LQWGLVPSFWVPADAAAPKFEFFKMFNARCETVGEKGVFRRLVHSKRCVVPLEAFYEWVATTPRDKQPYCVARADGKPLLVAALYDTWHGILPPYLQPGGGGGGGGVDDDDAAPPPSDDDADDGTGAGDGVSPARSVATAATAVAAAATIPHSTAASATPHVAVAGPGVLYSVTLLTTAAIPELAWLHDRMPLILESDADVAAWLDTGAHRFDDLTAAGSKLLVRREGVVATT